MCKMCVLTFKNFNFTTVHKHIYIFIVMDFDMLEIFSKMMTFNKLKIEILKCAWAQFPHVPKNPNMEKVTTSRQILIFWLESRWANLY